MYSVIRWLSNDVLADLHLLNLLTEDVTRTASSLHQLQCILLLVTTRAISDD